MKMPPTCHTSFFIAAEARTCHVDVQQTIGLSTLDRFIRQRTFVVAMQNRAIRKLLGRTQSQHVAREGSAAR
jgi:hypothetical protein